MMKSKNKNFLTMAFLLVLAAIVNITVGQIDYEPVWNELKCPEAGGTFCIGDSLATAVIGNCTSEGIMLFDCTQMLFELEPFGKKDDAACYQVSHSAGNATCFWRGKLYLPGPVSITMTLEERTVNHVETNAPDLEANRVLVDEHADDECLVPEDDDEALVTSSVTTTLDTRTVIETRNDIVITTTDLADIMYPGFPVDITDIESPTAKLPAPKPSRTNTISEPGRETDIPTITRTVITAATTESGSSGVAPVASSAAPNATRPFNFTNHTAIEEPSVGILTSFSPVSFETSSITPDWPKTSTKFVVVHPNTTSPVPSARASFMPDSSSNPMKHGAMFAFAMMCLMILVVL